MSTATIYSGTMTPESEIHSPAYGRITVAEAAEKAAGNWMQESHFVWFNDDNYMWPEDWFHYMIETRDSGLMEQSNAATMRRWLADYIEDGSIVEESHSHWAVGHVDKLIIRVYDRVMQDDSEVPEDYDARDYDVDEPTKRGPISSAFLMICQIMDEIDNYPILDEDDYSTRQYELGLSNIKDAFWYVNNAYGGAILEDLMPDNWEYEVAGFFSDSDEYDIVDGDSYPSEEQMFEAFLHLGWIDPDYLDQDQRMEHEVRKLAKALEDSPYAQQTFFQGLSYLDQARATLAGMVWEQKGKDD